MRILISSYRYHPDVGGVETSSRLLARQFVRAHHDVVLVTATAQGETEDAGVTVERDPSILRLLALVRWSDVFFHNNVSLRTALPLLWVQRPWIVTTQTWLSGPDGFSHWNGWLKRAALRRANNVYVSGAVERHIQMPGVRIPNPYDAEIFREIPGCLRHLDFVAVGRLVSDKGFDSVIKALALVHERGLRATLSIVGRGPEERRLRLMVAELGIGPYVLFRGEIQGHELAVELNRHRWMVVPSRWAEPFGIVALEGIACGCGIIGSEQGGLAEAIGPCGVTFPNGDVARLADIMADQLADPDRLRLYRSRAPGHLAAHAVESVADRYLEMFGMLCPVPASTE